MESNPSGTEWTVASMDVHCSYLPSRKDLLSWEVQLADRLPLHCNSPLYCLSHHHICFTVQFSHGPVLLPHWFPFTDVISVSQLEFVLDQFCSRLLYLPYVPHHTPPSPTQTLAFFTPNWVSASASWGRTQTDLLHEGRVSPFWSQWIPSAFNSLFQVVVIK